MKKRIGDFGQSKIVSVTIKSLLSAIIMGVFVYFTYKFVLSILGSGFVGDFVSLAISVLVGIIVYGISIILLRVEEVSIITDIIKKKIKKR